MNIRTTHPRRALAAAAVLAAAGLLLSACGTSTSHTAGHHDMSGMSMGPSDMPMAHGNGLQASADGYTLELRSGLMTTMAMPLRLVITKHGTPVTSYQTEQTKALHLYVVRDDLTGFQHLHPTMATDGTWSVTPASMAPGHYRVFAQFEPEGASEPLVLSVPAEAHGAASPASTLPPESRSTTADGYQVTLDGALTRGGTVKVSFAKGDKPVTDLQPYLETYAHVTGFREGDLAFTHLHPSDPVTGMGGGPDLSFMIEAPEPGTYRLFIQFMAAGSLHTAAITTAIS